MPSLQGLLTVLGGMFMILSGMGFALGEHLVAALILIASSILLLGAAVTWVATALGQQAEIMKNSVNRNSIR